MKRIKHRCGDVEIFHFMGTKMLSKINFELILQNLSALITFVSAAVMLTMFKFFFPTSP